MVKRVTVKDVAVAANVTAQTVSRVFRNSDLVSEETKKVVLDAAKRLNYIPNYAAISLRSGKEKSIAVVFDSLKNVYFSIMIDYLHREIRKYGYSLLTIFSDEPLITEKTYRAALSMGALGVISFLEAAEGLGGIVSACNVPLMILGRRSVMPQIDYVVTDDKLGGKLAAERLVQAGCRSFMYISIAMPLTCGDDRLQGFSEALHEQGYAPVHICAADDPERRLKELQEKDALPDGIFCFCDVLAFRIINALKQCGAKGVKVIGYDDLQAELNFPVRLTTIGTAKEEYVRYALNRLLAKIDGESSRIADIVPVYLQVGETA